MTATQLGREHDLPSRQLHRAHILPTNCRETALDSECAVMCFSSSAGFRPSDQGAETGSIPGSSTGKKKRARDIVPDLLPFELAW